MSAARTTRTAIALRPPTRVSAYHPASAATKSNTNWATSRGMSPTTATNVATMTSATRTIAPAAASRCLPPGSWEDEVIAASLA